MTDPEKPGEGFLQRWSRQKIESERQTSDTETEQAAPPATPRNEGAAAEQVAQNRDTTVPAARAKPPFDLSSLPSLDSITAATDIRAFLAPGVPDEIVRAALRRAWSADPAIRDFVGLAENAWDFTVPDAVGGFGELPPGYDVKKLIARVFGEIAPDTERNAAAAKVNRNQADSEPTTQLSGSTLSVGHAMAGEPSPGEAELKEIPTVARDDLVQSESNAAAQHSSSDQASGKDKKHRSHGGALPQ